MDGAARIVATRSGARPRLSAVERLPGVRRIHARYDAAQTVSENRKHWAAADSLSANAANSHSVRKTLRDRARYEVANNSYAQGILLTLANGTIGTGPRLQLTGPNEADNSRVEALWAEWARRIDLATKLRTMRLAKAQDGEAFGLLVTDPAVPLGQVALDMRLVECDRVMSPMGQSSDQPVDGIILDQLGRPALYQVLRQHPGDMQFSAGWEFDERPARSVLHYFTPLRPEQVRGIPEITSALPLFAQLRRYTLAVIAAAEVAADHAAVIQSDVPPNEEGPASVEAMDSIELEPRMATVLPQGWKLGQMDAVQPTTTFGEFKKEQINEVARCLNMPFNVAAGNSSGYNYASGRLDHQEYFRSLGIEQSAIERTILDRLFAEWINEAVLIEGYLPQSFRSRGPIPHQWFWDGNEHVDPEKEANAEETQLRTGMTTRAERYGRRGRDWRVEGEQNLAEKMAELEHKARLLARARELGLPDAVVLTEAVAPATPQASTEDGDGGVGDDVVEAKARLDAVGVAVRSGMVTPQSPATSRSSRAS